MTESAALKDVKVRETISEELAEQLHPALLKFSAPDIGLLKTHEDQDLLMGDPEWFFFFIHPCMTEDIIRAQVREQLTLSFPRGPNNFDDDKSIQASSIDRTDTIHHVPADAYLIFSPEAELFIELPF